MVMVMVMVMMMMMMISLISYFPFRDQLRLDLSKWLVYTCHLFPLHPSLVLSTIPTQQMTNQRVLHSVWRHFFLRNNQTLANPTSAFDRSFSEKKNSLLLQILFWQGFWSHTGMIHTSKLCMPDMVSAVTVTAPPKTGADVFPAFFKSTQTRETGKTQSKVHQGHQRLFFDVQSLTLYQDAVLIC